MGKIHFSFPAMKELVPIRQLPDPFLKPDGDRVAAPSEWEEQRRYLKAMLSHYMYGELPPPPKQVRGERLDQEKLYAGKGLLEHYRLSSDDGLSVLAEVIRPSTKGSCPVIVWNQFADMVRCPIEEEAVSRGYAIVSFDRTQFAPDEEGASRFTGGNFGRAYPSASARAVAIWGWGHSYVISWLQELAWVDRNAFVVTGYSRGGKAALWAGAFDERVALCAPSCSGCGGGGCYRYMGGRLGEGVGINESLGYMTEKNRFWYWYQDEMALFGSSSEDGKTEKEDLLPFDLHTVRALVAPRAILCMEGLDDLLSNGYGTQVAWRAAQEVYRFLGCSGNNALFFAEGGHEYSQAHWRVLLDYCDVIFRGRPQQLYYRRFAEKGPEVPALHFSWRAPTKKREN
jgi:hypothetical protein